MSNDYENSKETGELMKSIEDLRASLTISKQKKNSFDEDSYKQLLQKYSEAVSVIEMLKSKIDDYEKKKLPSKDEVESISAMLDLFGKLDQDTINKIERLGGKK